MMPIHEQINLRQTSPNTYSASWHPDWTLGKTLNGGTVAGIVHHAIATHLVTDPALVAKNQPDVLSLHIEYLRACEAYESHITITPLKIGSGACTLQLQLTQKDQLRVVALATSTNFDRSLGPTATTDWKLHPPVKPKPDFDLVEARKPDPNWIPGYVVGEVFTLTHRILILNPRDGFPVAGVCDAWNRFNGEERMDATYIALMSDIIPSLSDTLLRNNGLYDAHAFQKKLLKWAEENPGIPAKMGNTVAEAMSSSVFEATATLDIDFKKRVPKEGLRWIFVRTASKMMKDGRMDLEVTICDEDMDLVCVSRQLVLVVEAQRKFHTKTPKSSL